MHSGVRMKSATQPQPADRREPTPRTDRQERLDRAAAKVVEHARTDAERYLRESEVPAGGE